MSVNFKISLTNQNLLRKYNALKRHETNEYLLDSSNENYRYISRKFFLGESSNRVQLLNVGSNLFGGVSQVYSSYVGTPIREQNVAFDLFVADFVALDFATICLEREDNKINVVYCPAQNYFRQDGTQYTARFYIDESGDNRQYYTLIQEYQPGRTISRLYESVGLGVKSISNLGRQVPLETIYETADLQEEVETGLSVPAIFVVEKDPMSQVSTSTFEKIQSTVYSIDRKIVMMDTQYLQHTEQYTLFKGIKRPREFIQTYENNYGEITKKLNISAMGKNLMGDDSSSIEFIRNENPLIKEAMNYEEQQTRRLSSITAIPQEFLGLEQRNSAVGEGSRALMHGAFVKKIQEIRNVFDVQLRKIEEVMEQDNMDFIPYYRPDVFAKDDNERIAQIKEKRALGLISKVAAIMEIDGLDEEQATESLRQIEEENILLDNQQDDVQEENEEEEVREN